MEGEKVEVRRSKSSVLSSKYELLPIYGKDV